MKPCFMAVQSAMEHTLPLEKYRSPIFAVVRWHSHFCVGTHWSTSTWPSWWGGRFSCSFIKLGDTQSGYFHPKSTHGGLNHRKARCHESPTLLLGGYTRFKELFIMLPSLILYSTYSQDSDPCPGNTHGLKGFRLGLLLNSKEEILLR